MTTSVPSKHPVLCVLDSAVQTQHTTNHLGKSSSHIDGTEFPRCYWIFLCVQTKWFLTLVKCISPFGQPKLTLGHYNNHKILSLIDQDSSPPFECNRNDCILQSTISKCQHIFCTKQQCCAYVKKVVDGDRERSSCGAQILGHPAWQSER